jgi:hypothetical protein
LCRWYQHTGRICSHMLAVDQAETDRVLGPAPKHRYEVLFPTCKSGCNDIAEGYYDGYCDRCGSDREWQARRAAWEASR